MTACLHISNTLNTALWHKISVSTLRLFPQSERQCRRTIRTGRRDGKFAICSDSQAAIGISRLLGSHLGWPWNDSGMLGRGPMRWQINLTLAFISGPLRWRDRWTTAGGRYRSRVITGLLTGHDTLAQASACHGSCGGRGRLCDGVEWFSLHLCHETYIWNLPGGVPYNGGV